MPKDLPTPKPAAAGKVETVISEPPYDLDKFTYYTFSHCRTYILENAVNKALTSQTGLKFKPGDTIVIDGEKQEYVISEVIFTYDINGEKTVIEGEVKVQ